jgi:tRNA pseudouridine38-40 synthase
MRYLAKIEYDGSNFYGFQRLNDLRTVQKVLEEAVSIVNKEKSIIKGASRTDKGVHAYGQVIHFDLKYNIPVDRLVNAINSCLPSDVRVKKCVKVNDDFHARFNAYEKTYVYKINLGEYECIKDKYYLQYEYKLDIDLMEKCSKLLLGGHDFRNFVSGKKDNTKSIIYDINFSLDNNILEIKFIGKSFYKYMIRNMVGALIDVGRGKKSILELEKMINKQDECIQMMTASPNGLYLVNIKYENIDI